MIIGIEEYNVCEGLDTDKVAGLIERNRNFIYRVITVGIDRGCKSDDLGFRDACDDGSNKKTGDTIISCVKCFR